MSGNPDPGLLAALERAVLARGGRREGAEVRFLAPCHDDHRPSARWNRDKGTWYCDRCKLGGGALGLAERLGMPLPERRNGAPPTPARGDGPPVGKVVARYAYCDETGVLLFEVLRFEPKGFRQRRPNGKGGWTWNLDGVRRVLYRLPELLAAPDGEVVYVAEGEKDCERLRSLGLVATCNAGGAGKWRPEHSEALRDRHVVILPDHDPPGEAHARTVANALLGVAANVRVVQLPDLPEHGDTSDWLDRGGDALALEALVAATPVSRFSFPIGNQREKRESSGFVLTPLDALLDEPEEAVNWLVDDLLPAGGLSLLVAKPKIGKSTLSRDLAVRVARGEPFLGRATSQGPVLYAGLEEKRGEVARHFARMGGRGLPIHVHVGRAPEAALEALQTAVVEHRPVLVIVDPLARLVRIPDLNDYSQVTRGLEPLLALARESGCHLLATHHAPKVERGGGDDVLGSTALFGAVDTLLTLRRRDEARTIASVQRYGRDLEPTVLRLDPTTGLIDAAGELVVLQRAARGDEIVAALAVQGDATEAELREAIGGNTGLTGAALRTLVEAGRVTRTGSGRRGDPYRFTLAPSSPVDDDPVDDDTRFSRSHPRENEKRETDDAPDPPPNADGRCRVHQRLLTYAEALVGACSWCESPPTLPTADTSPTSAIRALM